MTDRLKSREAGAKAYAEATGYYTPFHAGLDSESANSIRKGTDAAIRAALDQSIKDGEFTDLLFAVSYSEDPVKAASAIVGAMAAVIEMKRGPAAVKQVMSAFSKS